MTTTTEPVPELLRQDCLGRFKTTRAQREKLVDEYERSGMRGPAFATFAGVKYSTLATWIQERRRQRSLAGAGAAPAPRPQWVEAVVGQAQSAGSAGLIVRVGTVAWMEVADTRGATLAAEVLRQLGGTPGCLTPSPKPRQTRKSNFLPVRKAPGAGSLLPNVRVKLPRLRHTCI